MQEEEEVQVKQVEAEVMQEAQDMEEAEAAPTCLHLSLCSRYGGLCPHE